MSFYYQMSLLLHELFLSKILLFNKFIIDEFITAWACDKMSLLLIEFLLSD